MSRHPLISHYCLPWNNQTLYPSSASVPQASSSASNVTTATMCHLVAGLFYNELYQSPTDPQQQYICSTHNEVFKYILQYLKCSLNFAHSNVDFGGRIVNGRWNGILALIDQKRADFIPHIFSTSYSRDTILDFQYLIPQKELLSLFSYPRPRAESPLNLFSSFSRTIWLLIGVFFLLYGALYWISGQKKDKMMIMKRRLGFSLIDTYTDMFAMLLGQGTVSLTNSPLRPSLFLWLFATFILRQLFATDITALLLSRGQVKLDTFEQLGQAEADVKILVENQSTSYYIFKEKFPKLMSRVELITYDDVASISTLQRVLHSAAVLVTGREYAELVKEYFEPVHFHIGSEAFASSIGNYAIRKSLETEQRNRLGRLFRYIYYFGLTRRVDQTITILHLRRALRDRTPLSILSSTTSQLLLRSRKKSNAATPTSDLTPSHTMYTYAYNYSLGIGVAIGVFIMEMILQQLIEGQGKI